MPDLGSTCSRNVNVLYIQEHAGRLMVEVGSPIITDNTGGLIVTGAATLAGTLEVRLDPNPHLVMGQSYSLLRAGSASGGFDNIIVPHGLQLNVQGGAYSVTVMNDCPADLDHNEVVNLDDLGFMLMHWGACPAPPAQCVGDLDGSGTIDVADLIMLIGEWGAL